MKTQELTAQEMHDLMIDALETAKFFKAKIYPHPYQPQNLIGLKGYEEGKFKEPR